MMNEQSLMSSCHITQSTCHLSLRPTTLPHPFGNRPHRFLGLRPVLHQEPLDGRDGKGVGGDLFGEAVCEGCLGFAASSGGRVEIGEQVVDLD